jgi:hypothetical protein
MANLTINGIEGLSKQQMKDMVKQGGKFVMFQYTMSIVVMTFRENSNIYFVKPGESAAKYHWGYTLLTCLMGWWGIPWGIIYTIGTLGTNIGGGKDLTLEVSNHLGLNSHEGYNVPGSNSSTSSSSSGTQQSGGYNIPGNSNPNTSGGGYNIPR